MASPPGYRVLPMGETHLGGVRRLCRALGYRVDARALAARLAACRGEPGSGLFVATDADGRVVGFVHVFRRPMLEDEPCAQVQAVVVDEAHRHRGLGSRLMARAEAWAAERGLRRIVLYSASGRADAHGFYARAGYRSAGPSLRYVKRLQAGGGTAPS